MDYHRVVWGLIRQEYNPDIVNPAEVIQKVISFKNIIFQMVRTLTNFYTNIYGPILMKVCMNANIIKTQFFALNYMP